MNEITNEVTSSIANGIPVFMSIRKTAQTGILSEVALRSLLKQGKLPGIYSGERFKVNFGQLCEMLEKGSKPEESFNTIAEQ